MTDSEEPNPRIGGMDAGAGRARAAGVAGGSGARTSPEPRDPWRSSSGAGRLITDRSRTRGSIAGVPRLDDADTLVTRRSMLRIAFWAGAGTAAAGTSLVAVNYLWPRRVTGFGSVFSVPAARIPASGGGPPRLAEAKAWLVNLAPGEGVPPQFQAYGQPSERGGLPALFDRWPGHRCTIAWWPDFVWGPVEGTTGWFRCPCRGSTFTRAGLRVFGPAPRSMDTFAVTITSDGAAEIHTSRIRPGGPDNATRAALSSGRNR